MPALPLPSRSSAERAAGRLAKTPAIELARSRPGFWSATYRLASPSTQLDFANSVSGGGRTAWVPQRGFEIVHSEGSDYLRRKDGKSFRVVRVEAPARFVPSPGDYALFVNFSDNSLLIYTGKFLTCANRCASGTRWNLTARVKPSEEAIVDGQARSGRIALSDRRQGRYLFIGHIKPIETPNFAAVIDPALPTAVRESGNGQWLWRVTWYFAHEASNVFQRAGKVGGADSLIHEGAAEMFAALALKDSSPEAASYVQSRLTADRDQCADGLKQTSFGDVAKALQLNLHYSCGLVLQERFDRKIRQTKPGSDGLFALWRNYESRVENSAPAGRDTYLAAVEALAGAETAQWGRHIVSDRVSDPEAALATDER